MRARAPTAFASAACEPAAASRSSFVGLLFAGWAGACFCFAFAGAACLFASGGGSGLDADAGRGGGLEADPGDPAHMQCNIA
eukprot:4568884-Prymnesium_polylepis.2